VCCQTLGLIQMRRDPRVHQKRRVHKGVRRHGLPAAPRGRGSMSIFIASCQSMSSRPSTRLGFVRNGICPRPGHPRDHHVGTAAFQSLARFSFARRLDAMPRIRPIGSPSSAVQRNGQRWRGGEKNALATASRKCFHRLNLQARFRSGCNAFCASSSQRLSGYVVKLRGTHAANGSRASRLVLVAGSGQMNFMMKSSPCGVDNVGRHRKATPSKPVLGLPFANPMRSAPRDVQPATLSIPRWSQQFQRIAAFNGWGIMRTQSGSKLDCPPPAIIHLIRRNVFPRCGVT